MNEQRHGRDTSHDDAIALKIVRREIQSLPVTSKVESEGSRSASEVHETCSGSD